MHHRTSLLALALASLPALAGEETEPCSDYRRVIEPPADFLLPFWMGRCYGFVRENR